MSNPRACGTCAWWEDRDSVYLVDGIWQQKVVNGGPFPYMGPGRCMYDPQAISKEPDDWCRHHTTARKWDTDSSVDNGTREDLQGGVK